MLLDARKRCRPFGGKEEWYRGAFSFRLFGGESFLFYLCVFHTKGGIVMRLTGAQILMECLLEQGVDTVFGYPGGAVLNLYDALYEYRGKIRHIRTAHEQAAAHAADGYARASGKTGVCIATSGPGATNLVTGIATAWMDSIPMVAITGNVARHLLGKNSFQEVDITAITRPVTKKSILVRDASELASVVREAFDIAQSGRKGPVLIDIPKDVSAQTAEFVPQAPQQVQKPAKPSQQALRRAAAMLEESERPFLYGGGGVIASNAEKEFALLAEKLDAPVSCSLMCQGGFDQDNERYLGMLGMHGTKASAETMKHCDLLIAVGSRFSDRVLCDAERFGRNCRILHIDIDAREFGKNIGVDQRIQGDVGEILRQLLPLLKQQNHKNWMERVASWKRKYPLQQQAKAPDEVLAREKIPVIELVFSNSTLGMVRQWQKLFYSGHFSESDVDDAADCEKLAEAFGVRAMTISRKSEIEPVLRQALQSNGPVFINCPGGQGFECSANGSRERLSRRTHFGNEFMNNHTIGCGIYDA
jgi:acetolactate synthase I/II/III large subunit